MPAEENSSLNPALRRLVEEFPVGCRVRNTYSGSQFYNQEGKVVGHCMDTTIRIPRAKVEVVWPGQTPMTYSRLSLEKTPIRLADLQQRTTQQTHGELIIERWEVTIPSN